MSEFWSKLKGYLDIRYNKLSKLYLAIFYVLFAVELYLEVSKNKLGILFNTYPEQQKFYFDKLQSMTSLISFMDNLLIAVNLLYLILNTIKYEDRIDDAACEYLIVSLTSLLSVKIVSIILHGILSVYYLAEPTLLVGEVTITVLILALVRMAFKFLLSKNKFEL